MYKSQRKTITEYLNKIFKSLETEIDLDYFVAESSITQGISENKIREIIKTFEKAEIIKIKEGEKDSYKEYICPFKEDGNSK